MSLEELAKTQGEFNVKAWKLDHDLYLKEQLSLFSLTGKIRKDTLN